MLRGEKEMNEQAFRNFIAEKQPNICQIAACKDNALLYSDTWNNYEETDCVHIASVTKSIMSLLVGIAIGNGQIKSVDDKVLDYFPEYKVKRGERTIYDVAIKHLLTMTAPYKGKSEPWKKVCTSSDWTLTTLDVLGGRKGLTGEFRYSTLGIQILSAPPVCGPLPEGK